MAWIESHQTLANHPKLLKLSSLTGYDLDKCIAKLHRLWWWALTYAEDGDLVKFSAQEIGLGIAITDFQEAEKFWNSLKEANWVDRESLVIHDWLDYAGLYLIKKYNTSNPRKLREIWKKHGFIYGRGKGKGAKVKEKTAGRQVFSKENTKRDIPNQTKPNQTIPEKDSRARFDEFWAAYPKKRSKGQAEKAFQKIHPDEQLLARMLSSIGRAKTSDDWKRQGGRYVPYPATWLNAKGWEDEIRDPAGNGGRGKPEAIFARCPKCHKETTADDLRKFGTCAACFKPLNPEAIRELIKGIGK